jgi:glycosyltransferase involved in cell wall biosynthesis
LDRLGPALVSLLQRPEEREALARRGTERAQQFSLRRVADAYEALYRDRARNPAR